MLALICGCSTPKPPSYTRFPQTLIPPPPTTPESAAPISTALSGSTVLVQPPVALESNAVAPLRGDRSGGNPLPSPQRQ